MRIINLKIENFRGVKSADLTFDGHMWISAACRLRKEPPVRKDRGVILTRCHFSEFHHQPRLPSAQDKPVSAYR